MTAQLLLRMIQLRRVALAHRLVLIALASLFSLQGWTEEPGKIPFTTSIVAGGQGLPIAVTTGGNAQRPTLLFVHGFLASTLHWQKQMTPGLAEEFHLVFVDMRGHGASAKPAGADHYLEAGLFADDIRAAITAAKIDKPVLVGWSYGGLFIMDYLRRYGVESVSGIVLAGSTAGLLPAPPAKPDTPERREQIERSRSPDLMTIRQWTDGFVDFLTRDGPLPAEEVDTLRLSAMLVPHYVRRALRERSTDNTDLLDKLRLPVLLISGTDDISAKAVDMARLGELLPDALLRTYENTGPMTFWYRADRFNADLANFVHSLGEGAGH